jgi:hypothetical protein
MSHLPVLQDQWLPIDDIASVHQFKLRDGVQLIQTEAAIRMYSAEVIGQCLALLQSKAGNSFGLDYFQVFIDESKPSPLWLIEDKGRKTITARLDHVHEEANTLLS